MEHHRDAQGGLGQKRPDGHPQHEPLIPKRWTQKPYEECRDCQFRQRSGQSPYTERHELPELGISPLLRSSIWEGFSINAVHGDLEESARDYRTCLAREKIMLKENARKGGL